MPSDIDHLKVFVSCSVDIVSECLNNGFKSINAWYRISAESLDGVNEFFDETSFLFTVLG